MAFLPVHPLSPITSSCFQSTATNGSYSNSDHDQPWNFKKVFLKTFSWPGSQLFPTNSCPGRAAGALYCSAGTRRRSGDGVRGRNTSGHYCHRGQDTAELQPNVLLLAWLRLTTGLWESYLAFLYLSTLISGIAKWSHWILPNLEKIRAADEGFSVNVSYMLYCTLAFTDIRAHNNSFPMDIFVSEIGLWPEMNRTSLGILCSC